MKDLFAKNATTPLSWKKLDVKKGKLQQRAN